MGIDEDRSAGLHGYISTGVSGSEAGFGSGVSFYTSVWSLLEGPLDGFQMGLPSTWISPDNADATDLLCPVGTHARDAADAEVAAREAWQHEDPATRSSDEPKPDWSNHLGDLFRGYFQTIEGGVGTWTSTAFPTAEPKYRINGVPDCYSTELSSPGFSFYGNGLPDGSLGIAQLSNRCLLPIDGIPFAPQASGVLRDEMLGVAWMALPLTAPKGWFRLETAAAGDAGKSLEGNRVSPQSDLGGASFMTPTGNFSGQMFTFVPASAAPGYCHLETLFTRADNRALEGNVVAPGSTFHGGAFMAPKGPFTGQLWRVIPDGDGYVRLVTQLSHSRGECLDSNPNVPGAGLNGAAHMATWVDDGEAAQSQRWRIVPLAYDEGPAAGEQSWTLFLNSGNFSGPVACFVPTAWSRVNRMNDAWQQGPLGQTLDIKPANMGSGAMELAQGPAFFEQIDDTMYTRIPAVRFPTVQKNNTTISPLMQDITFYSPKAIATRLADWLHDETRTMDTSFDPAGSRPATVTAPAGNGFDLDQRSRSHILDVSSRVKVVKLDGASWGLEWEPGQPAGVLPEYFATTGPPVADQPRRFAPITSDELPEASTLQSATFAPAAAKSRARQGSTAAWTAPGPVKSPDGTVLEQTATLGDGSTVTYHWYRFRDQPVFADAGYTDAELDELQRRVERIHREWTSDGTYLAAPTAGNLVSIDDAALVDPPAGYEVGYVPIVVAQAAT